MQPRGTDNVTTHNASVHHVYVLYMYMFCVSADCLVSSTTLYGHSWSRPYSVKSASFAVIAELTNNVCSAEMICIQTNAY